MIEQIFDTMSLASSNIQRLKIYVLESAGNWFNAFQNVNLLPTRTDMNYVLFQMRILAELRKV